MPNQIQLFALLFFLLGITGGLIAQSLEVPLVDNTTYRGKAMFGYQGWFGHPNDQSPRPDYWHWGDMDQIGVIPLEVEMYPDLREYCTSERYPTAYTLPNGQIANVFSSGNKQTVIRHMKWVRDYHTDGVFLQRFISEYGDPVVMEFRDSTTVAVKEGCEKYGRVFAVMYDGVGDKVSEIKADWMHLVDDLGILDSDRYLNHEGRPLVALWGFTFYNDATVEQLDSLINWFHQDAPAKYRASVKLGLNDDWFTLGQDWQDAFEKVEVISPWSVGRFNDPGSYNHYLINQLQNGKAWCDSQNILFVPVLFPGFSWHNLMDGGPQNEIPRDGGNFFWMQANGALNNNMESMYFAMLDEVDESTAFFKTAENDSQAPAQGYWLNLDADGYGLPSDWYLRCAGKAAETLRGNMLNTTSLGTPPEGIMSIRPDDSNCSLQFLFPDFVGADSIEISLDGGSTFLHRTSNNVGTFEISGLATNTYEIVVRHPGGNSVAMGTSCLECMVNSIEQENTNLISIYPNPAVDEIIVSGLEGTVEIRLSDINGRLIRAVRSSAFRTTLDVSDLARGIYVVSIISDLEIFTHKVILTNRE